MMDLLSRSGRKIGISTLSLILLRAFAFIFDSGRFSIRVVPMPSWWLNIHVRGETDDMSPRAVAADGSSGASLISCVRARRVNESAFHFASTGSPWL
ncbi:uncharacterized protein C8Q71DRAFT_755479 [Rhodofomes roseus]|uniref:Secreted protein n=1 Tax=Rhodofomes roseus TaxID=34475 RepID=A0ABQ8KJ42_9APHY|nr:uncharacterized protein C8Q71DRAFT_755479 [Rhodofomes roseus]KAH9837988.1 hypothetical protein C8Q71DRAFT_755479 [Rhodofomes roseus]